MQEKCVVYTDGGCRMNPGPGSWAYVIYLGGRRITGSGFVEHATNNSLEYEALAEAAKFLLTVEDLGPEVEFRSDSMLCVQQLNGNWAVKTDGLRDVFSLTLGRIAKLRQRVPVLTIRHIPRAQNKEADAICNEVQDQYGVVGLSWKSQQALRS